MRSSMSLTVWVYVHVQSLYMNAHNLKNMHMHNSKLAVPNRTIVGMGQTSTVRQITRSYIIVIQMRPADWLVQWITTYVMCTQLWVHETGDHLYMLHGGSICVTHTHSQTLHRAGRTAAVSSTIPVLINIVLITSRISIGPLCTCWLLLYGMEVDMVTLQAY